MEIGDIGVFSVSPRERNVNEVYEKIVLSVSYKTYGVHTCFGNYEICDSDYLWSILEYCHANVNGVIKLTN